MHIAQFTPEKRKSELEKGRGSLFYFQTAILGFVPRKRNGDLIPNPDAPDLCAFLEGRSPHQPWNRACICAYRGQGKSISVFSYCIWRGLYIEGFSCRVIQNSFENAKKNYTERLLNLFGEGERAGYLHWLYEDRLKPNLDGCNQSQFSLRSSKPLAYPFMTIQGMESKFESYHGDLIVMDDPEGADADTSTVGNEASYKAIQKLPPLLNNQAEGQILLVATPHGNNPIVYRMRDRENPPWQSESDNKRTSWKFWWRPLTDGNSNTSRWPAAFPPSAVEELRKDPDSAQNYWLLRKVAVEDLFDMKAVTRAFYAFALGTRDVIRYKGFEFDPDVVSEDGFVAPIAKDCEIKIKSLRFFLHFDPLHKTQETRRSQEAKRPSRAAIAVIGIAPDYHAFLIDSWTGDAPIERQAEHLFRFYRKYAPSLVVYEGIGAQAWLPSIVKQMEGMNPFWGRPDGFGEIAGGLKLPRMSSRMIESEKNSSLGKDYLYREILGPWVNRGLIHFRSDQDEIWNQLERALDPTQPVDLLDCLSQGPIPTTIQEGRPKRLVWQPPTDEQLLRDYARRRKFVEATVGMLHKMTGYRSPGWRQ